MYFFSIVLCILFSLDGALTECPNINDIPVLTDDGAAFYCTRFWEEWGDSEPIKACNGIGYDLLDNTDWTAERGYMMPFGSLIVKAGCTLYGYQDYNYGGHLIKYYGPATFPEACVGNDCPRVRSSDWSLAKGFRSYQCRCAQDPIICQPEDEWVTIMQCDNTQSSVETTCSYTKTIGTTWSAEAQISMSIDITIDEAMSAAFFKFFEEDLGISATTGYDWTATSSQAKSETETFKVESIVPPYTLLQIDGAEGNCGGNNVKTELFRTITLDPQGNVLSEKFERLRASNNSAISSDDSNA